MGRIPFLMPIVLSCFVPAVFISCGVNGDQEFQSARLPRDLTPTERAETRQSAADAKGVMTFSFTAGRVEDTSLDIDPKLGLISQHLKLQQKPRTWINYSQIERAHTALSFTQGYDGVVAQDSFEVVEAGKVDILIVVDDSQTMTPIQAQLSGALPELLTHIKNLNWQIAINTTSTPCLRQTAAGIRILTKQQYDLDAAKVIADYHELIQVGNSGDNFERGIRSAGLGLEGYCPTGNSPWRRGDAKPAVLIVSDEKNCGSSNGEGCPGEDYESPDFVTSRVPDVRVYALLLLESYVPACPDSGNYDNFYPDTYIDLVSSTGGIFDSICQPSYSTVMQNISHDVSQQVVKKYLLSQTPESEPILSLDGKVVANTYVMEGRVLRVTQDLPLSAKTLAITYHHHAVPRTKNYNLTGIPDPRSIKVQINGVKLAQNAYIFDGDAKLLTLNAMPPDLAKIAIDFRENDPLEDHFDFGSEAVLKTLAVSVDGEAIKEYTVDDGQVVIAPPPLDGAAIEISYEKPGDRTTNYRIVGVDPAVIERITALDETTGSAIPLKQAAGELILAEADVAPGRLVVLSYKITHKPEELRFNLPLLFQPIPGTLEIITEELPGNCPVPNTIGNLTLDFQCRDDDFSQLKVRYRFARDYSREFDVGQRAFSKVLVYIDGKVLADRYQVKDGKVLIDEAMVPVGAQVKVVVAP